MGWKDAPVVDAPKTPKGKAAWESAPALDAAPVKLGDTVPEAPATPPSVPSRPTDRYADMSMGERAMDDLSFAKDRLRDLYNTTGRMAGKAVVGTAALPVELGTRLFNVLSPNEGRYLETPSEKFDTLLNKYIPPPETTAGRWEEAIGAGVLGGRFPVPGMPIVTSPVGPPRLKTPPVPVEKVLAAGAKHDVPVYYDDLTNGTLAKKVGVAAESIPYLGTGEGRAAQNVAAKDAANRLVAEAAPKGVDDVAGGVQEGLKRQLGVFRREKDRLYGVAQDLLEPAGRMATPKFNARLHAALETQTKRAAMGIDNKELLNQLNTWKEQGRAGTFMETADLRSTVDDTIDAYFKGRNTTIGKKGVQDLIALRNSLDSDLEDFATSVGGDAEKAWRAADDFYKTNLVPFKVRGFKDLVKNDEPEKAWTYLMAQSGIGSRAERMYNALDEPGRQTVRYGLVKDAYESALNEKGIFSPAKFAGYMEKNKNVVDQFFKGSEREEVAGFTTLMRHIERAGQYAENPPTGNRLLVPALFGASFMGNAGSRQAAVAAAGSSFGAKLMFQTKTGRDLLLRMSRQKPGSPAADATANRIGRYLNQAAGQTTLELNEPEEEQTE